ncbi:entericidin EcnAB [Hungatella hominis]|mgnify:FL=1|uniref:Entericidin EcnAB n=1 Tax=Hungatella hominis TaxID=2763050 RepID=A0ABR7H966_9FIRM|nr:entericidin EcnAB [Hungatella hominis]MBC5709707.1 entericidin EcnAB [Hungatella hominis]
MKKKLLIIAAVLVFALSAAACSSKKEAAAPTTSAKTETSASTTTRDESGAADSGSDSTGDSQNSEGTVTGVVEENKGFMITIVAEEGEEAYVFPLDETQSEEYKDIKSGDKITVSYTNGLPTPDNLDTVVTDIQPAK